jgi:hypothetical protein
VFSSQVLASLERGAFLFLGGLRLATESGHDAKRVGGLSRRYQGTAELGEAAWRRPRSTSRGSENPPGLDGQIVGTDLPGEEEEGRLLQELAELFDKDPLEYARRKESVARLLCTNQAAVQKAAMMLRRAMPRVEDEPELSQASKAVAIGIKQSLWRSPNGEAYATVRVGNHSENYRIKSSPYEQWLRQAYAESKVKLGNEWLPQVPGAGALKDALATLSSQALFGGSEYQPATRVGWDESGQAIWIDLGDADWRSVKVTAEGWKVVSEKPSNERGRGLLKGGSRRCWPSPQRRRPLCEADGDG